MLFTLLLSLGLRAGAEVVTFSEQTFEVVRLDLKKTELKLHWRRPDGSAYGSLAALREALPGPLLLLTNSGIYDREYRPLGLHVEGGRQMRPLNKSRAPGGNFSMVPNGVFLLTEDGRARVVETSEYAQVKERVREATQSGPLLVHAGRPHPEFTKGSENKKLRSGVGVDEGGRVVFAISQAPVSFHDFADLFRSALKCANALYLDGTISQLWQEGQSTPEALVPFVGIWSARTR